MKQLSHKQKEPWGAEGKDEAMSEIYCVFGKGKHDTEMRPTKPGMNLAPRSQSY